MVWYLVENLPCKQHSSKLLFAISRGYEGTNSAKVGAHLYACIKQQGALYDQIGCILPLLACGSLTVSTD